MVQFIQTVVQIIGLGSLFIAYKDYQKREKIKKKEEQKEISEIAALIKIEVDEAESGINKIKRELTIQNVEMLRNNFEIMRSFDTGWQDKRYKFVSFFSLEDYKLIDQFFQDCKFLEYEVMRYRESAEVQITEKLRYAQRKILDAIDKEEYKNNPENYIKQMFNEYGRGWPLSQPEDIINRILKISEDIRLISGTTAYSSLITLAQKK